MATHATKVPTSVPAGMPILGRGRHRNPRRGACFMEMASYLAGERWSDHPACTHPLLASVARLVNDDTPDAERQHLAPFVTAVIGLTSDDPRWDVVIARRVAAEAIADVSERRQRVLAVALLVTERHLATLDGREAGATDPRTTAALRSVPMAWSWARDFVASHEPGRLAHFHRRAAPTIVVTAVTGITESGSAATAERLRALLTAAIADCTELRDEQPATAPISYPPLPPAVHRQPRRRHVARRRKANL
jgi:hypothetical protein